MTSTSFPVLQTERLILRTLSPADEPEIYQLRSDENVLKYIDRNKAHSAEDARKFIDSILGGMDQNASFYWAVALKRNNRLIGTICLWNFTEQNQKAETGYELLPAFQGKGYMQEALASVLTFGFENLNLSAIQAFTHPKNAASIRLLLRNRFHRLSPTATTACLDPGTEDTAIFELKRENMLSV